MCLAIPITLGRDPHTPYQRNELEVIEIIKEGNLSLNFLREVPLVALRLIHQKQIPRLSLIQSLTKKKKKANNHDWPRLVRHHLLQSAQGCPMSRQNRGSIS